MSTRRDGCPLSGTKGKPVDLMTVKALLTAGALSRLEAAKHRFCPEAACEVVYSDALGNAYLTSDVRVPRVAQGAVRRPHGVLLLRRE